jgi:stage II sporulation protein R
MKKIAQYISFALLFGAFVYMGSLASDKMQLSDDILRLHVVGSSNSEKDQAIKLMVRDAVLAAVEEITEGAINKEEVERCLQEHLQTLETVANAVLEEQGLTDRASVTLMQEEFPAREYETFTLPAGVYDSLRVNIGQGNGRNWWCVVFPNLCIPAASEDTADIAVGAGLSGSLSGAITGDKRYEVRFLLLDVWGRLENFFRKG